MPAGGQFVEFMETGAETADAGLPLRRYLHEVDGPCVQLYMSNIITTIFLHDTINIFNPLKLEKIAWI